MVNFGLDIIFQTTGDYVEPIMKSFETVQLHETKVSSQQTGC